jgi:methylase of polypeptide subunit release factors
MTNSFEFCLNFALNFNLRRYTVAHSEPATIVDVGSGDGYLVHGLVKAFPQAAVCGIECQRDLYQVGTLQHNLKSLVPDTT